MTPFFFFLSLVTVPSGGNSTQTSETGVRRSLSPDRTKPSNSTECTVETVPEIHSQESGKVDPLPQLPENALTSSESSANGTLGQSSNLEPPPVSNATVETSSLPEEMDETPVEPTKSTVTPGGPTAMEEEVPIMSNEIPVEPTLNTTNNVAKSSTNVPVVPTVVDMTTTTIVDLTTNTGPPAPPAQETHQLLMPPSVEATMEAAAAPNPPTKTSKKKSTKRKA